MSVKIAKEERSVATDAEMEIFADSIHWDKVRRAIVCRLPRSRCEDVDDVLSIAYLAARERGYYGKLLVRKAVGQYWREQRSGGVRGGVSNRGESLAQILGSDYRDAKLDLDTSFGKRTRRVCTMLVHGYSPGEIAKELGISPRRVRFIRQRLVTYLRD